MSRKLESAIAVIGIDIGKNSFHVVGHDGRGAIVLRLGKISRRGNRYLRILFVQAAWVVLIKPKSREHHGLKSWIEAARKTAASQRAGDRDGQQAGPHRLVSLGPWSGLRGEVNRQRST